MCPVTQPWVEEVYVDKVTNLPARINKTLEQNLIKTARSVLSKSKYHHNLLFADVERMKSVLLSELKETEKALESARMELEVLRVDLENAASAKTEKEETL